MSISVCLTINERPLPVLTSVFRSLDTQEYDQLIVVLDAASAAVAEFCRAYWISDRRVTFIERLREPGWRSPVKAWNAGYAAVTSDHIYCLSSETVQASLNVVKARMMLAEEPAVVFGRAECSCGPTGQEVNWAGRAPGNLLCDAAHPRPLGFIWAAPMQQVRQIGGWDERYDDGLWYDEADFFLRLWRTGLPFVFTDTISGTHLHHERPRLATPDGQAAILRNQAYTLQKYGSLDPLGRVLKREERVEGRTTWRHL